MKISRQIDLNLFHVFAAIMKHRSVARAAAELSLSPSAVSHALARLRQMLQDDLFVRSDTGLQPTPRAMELSGRVNKGLQQFEAALMAVSFDPAKSPRCFRIAASDFFAIYALPHLVQRLSATAPQVDLQIFPVSRLDLARQLETRTLDLVIGWFDKLPGFLRRAPFVEERGAIVVRTGHPLTEGEVTSERLLAFPHIVVEFTGTAPERGDGFVEDRGMVRRIRMEQTLMDTRRGREAAARVAVTVPYFSAVPPVLRVSNYVASLPYRFAREAVAGGGLVLLDLALERGAAQIDIVWHMRDDGDPGLRWLVEEIRNAGATAVAALS
ncbi:MAG: hypothetical protein B7Y12_05590 [Rhizobiales bacterium 24-66-13]|jgi:DNA-binding transcriptional LysR family regulator|uniref:LysR family transcriptional regulator n=1 Tax=Roseixanthobacter finlandensis TaxID=3119922 RepID=UPI000BD00EB1|nr:MAG: hypothetical protein B7Y61_04080 [Rhizobiales bacterium 35-66-30]OYZ81950.1 MAG: hypothetical protein B7Y12_05590 [Rhizobiales bacterium 24-66-13]OZB10108.1 MAG: hypothetical protein B7X67_06245 [Rhizobiales bacterium 39-66-18]